MPTPLADLGPNQASVTGLYGWKSDLYSGSGGIFAERLFSRGSSPGHVPAGRVGRGRAQTGAAPCPGPSELAPSDQQTVDTEAARHLEEREPFGGSPGHMLASWTPRLAANCVPSGLGGGKPRAGRGTGFGPYLPHPAAVPPA